MDKKTKTKTKTTLQFCLRPACLDLGGHPFLWLLPQVCPQQPVLEDVRPTINNPQLTNQLPWPSWNDSVEIFNVPVQRRKQIRPEGP